MRLPRMTTRRLATGIAVVAVLISAERTWHRWAFYRDKAEWYDRLVIAELRFHSIVPTPPFVNCMGPQGEDAILMVNYHNQMRIKYEYAMWHPWVTATPDPPPPWPKPRGARAVRAKAPPIDAGKLRELLRPKRSVDSSNSPVSGDL
jgi:hypothetical protein